MRPIKCSLAYHKTNVGKLDTFAAGVKDGIYGNPTTFVTPIITEVDFDAAIRDYVFTYAAYVQGGNAQKGPYYASEETLMGMLDDQAVYVDSVAQGNVNLIWISGFKPTKGTVSKKPAPAQCVGVEVKRGSTGVLLAECENQDVVDTYICIVTAGAPIPNNVNINDGGQLAVGENAPAIPLNSANPAATALPLIQSNGGIFDFNKTRKKKFLGLTPGVTYYITFFGINAAGVGQFSDPVGIVCW